MSDFIAWGHPPPPHYCAPKHKLLVNSCWIKSQTHVAFREPEGWLSIMLSCSKEKFKISLLVESPGLGMSFPFQWSSGLVQTAHYVQQASAVP